MDAAVDASAVEEGMSLPSPFFMPLLPCNIS